VVLLFTSEYSILLKFFEGAFVGSLTYIELLVSCSKANGRNYSQRLTYYVTKFLCYGRIE
jgi:hypothetical protein